MKLKVKSFWPGVVWFLASSIAFFLPGVALPEGDWFDKIKFDKLVHIGLFGIMILLWCGPIIHKPVGRLNSLVIQIPLAFFGYSILVELIQHFFIPGRSFDLFDILADGIGCGIGFLLVKRYQRDASATK